MAGSRGERIHGHGDHEAINVLGELTPAEAFELVRIARRESGEAYNVQPDFYQNRVTGETPTVQRAGAPLGVDQTGRAQPRTREQSAANLRRDVNQNTIRIRGLTQYAAITGFREGGSDSLFQRTFFAAGIADFVIARRAAFLRRYNAALNLPNTARGGRGAPGRLGAAGIAFQRSVVGATLAAAAVGGTQLVPGQGASGQLRSELGARTTDFIVQRVRAVEAGLGLVGLRVDRVDSRFANLVDRFNNLLGRTGAIISGSHEDRRERNTRGFPRLRARFDYGIEPFNLEPLDDIASRHGPFAGTRTPTPVPAPVPAPPLPVQPYQYDEDIPGKRYINPFGQAQDDEEDNSTLVLFRHNPGGQRTIDAVEAELNSRRGRREDIRIV